MIYKPSPGPLTVGAGLLDWLRREFQAISNAMIGSMDLQITSKVPEKAREGSLRYADGTNWNPGSGKGVYVYDGSAWVKL